MKHPSIFSLAVYLFAFSIAAVAFYIIIERDRSITHQYSRYHSTMDTAAMYFSDREIQTANTFSDSTLPALQRLGLIVRYKQQNWETLIIVSGPVWKQRSFYFKEQFLNHLSVYNKVRGFPTPARIVDHRTGTLLAQITASDKKEVFE
ncbi:MAG: hypothetical protein AB1600_01710 [Bacteroidota bacterium]